MTGITNATNDKLNALEKRLMERIESGDAIYQPTRQNSSFMPGCYVPDSDGPIEETKIEVNIGVSLDDQPLTNTQVW